jgi:hypothetical protein
MAAEKSEMRRMESRLKVFAQSLECADVHRFELAQTDFNA